MPAIRGRRDIIGAAQTVRIWVPPLMRLQLEPQVGHAESNAGQRPSRGMHVCTALSNSESATPSQELWTALGHCCGCRDLIAGRRESPTWDTACHVSEAKSLQI